MNNIKIHLNVINLGLALGITWGVTLFLLGIAAWLVGWGTPLVNVLGSLYIGYTPTFWGSVIGAIWSFVDGFIGGVIIAWIYNLFSGNKEIA